MSYRYYYYYRLIKRSVERIMYQIGILYILIWFIIFTVLFYFGDDQSENETINEIVDWLYNMGFISHDIFFYMGLFFCVFVFYYIEKQKYKKKRRR